MLGLWGVQEVREKRTRKGVESWQWNVQKPQWKAGEMLPGLELLCGPKLELAGDEGSGHCGGH